MLRRPSQTAVLLVMTFAWPSIVQAADALPVYDATQVAYGNYTIVKRIWVGEWRSAFSIGGEGDLERARRGVIERAARAGADAVVNLTCMSRTDRLIATGGYYCYADAVKLKSR